MAYLLTIFCCLLVGCILTVLAEHIYDRWGPWMQRTREMRAAFSAWRFNRKVKIDAKKMGALLADSVSRVLIKTLDDGDADSCGTGGPWRSKNEDI